MNQKSYYYLNREKIIKSQLEQYHKKISNMTPIQLKEFRQSRKDYYDLWYSKKKGLKYVKKEYFPYRIGKRKVKKPLAKDYELITYDTVFRFTD